MKRYPTLILGIAFWAVMGTTAIPAAPLEAVGHPHRESLKAVHDAEHEVDQAWEVYHRAALGGTVASPTLQAEIEEHLHQARTLITEAQAAADQGNPRQVEALVQQVRTHTTHAIEGSQESKP